MRVRKRTGHSLDHAAQHILRTPLSAQEPRRGAHSIRKLLNDPEAQEMKAQTRARLCSRLSKLEAASSRPSNAQRIASLERDAHRLLCSPIPANGPGGLLHDLQALMRTRGFERLPQGLQDRINFMHNTIAGGPTLCMETNPHPGSDRAAKLAQRAHALMSTPLSDATAAGYLSRALSIFDDPVSSKLPVAVRDVLQKRSAEAYMRMLNSRAAGIEALCRRATQQDAVKLDRAIITLTHLLDLGTRRLPKHRDTETRVARARTQATRGALFLATRKLIELQLCPIPQASRQRSQATVVAR